VSRKCAACAHPDRSAIDANLAEGGRSIRGIAQTFVLSEHSLARHRRNHLPKREIQAAQETRVYDHHKKLRVLEKVLFSVLTRRLKDQDDAVVLRTHQQLLRHYEFEVKLGEIEEIKAQIAALTEQIREREEMR